MFEVQDLKYATLATVSRCGMVWFSEEVVTPEMVITNYMNKLRNIPLEESEEDLKRGFGQPKTGSETDQALSPAMQVCIERIRNLSSDTSLDLILVKL